MRTPGLLALTATVFAVGPIVAQDTTHAAAKPEKPKPEKRVDISKLKFMTGCWGGTLGNDKDRIEVEETWSTLSDNLLLSFTRYLKKGHATGFEFSRIEVTDSGVVFAARSAGETEEDSYTMKRLVDDYVLFENPLKKKFPQRIMYRMASDGSLIPRNEGDGPSVEIRFHRIKCPGADIKLRPDDY
ncbi:MAG TPA: DUF6265 family protein [Gemmatimonadales bacterium]|nr:DUF6265 family protein [Gemmatimonadales bacterium]